MNGYTVVHTAAMVKDPRYLALLLDRGISPDLLNRDGQTPLFSAITGRRDAQFRALLAAEANLNIVDSAGDTPLHKAALVNDFDCTRVLLEAGANPRTLNAQKATFQGIENMNARASEALPQHQTFADSVRGTGAQQIDAALARINADVYNTGDRESASGLRCQRSNLLASGYDHRT